MQKNAIILGVVMLVLGGLAGFFGGSKYAQSKTSATPNFANLSAAQRQQFRANGGFGGRGGASGGGFVNGQILSKDTQSLTIKMSDGSSKIVFYSGSTTIGKIASGTPDDLLVGEQVLATGTANSDGSVAAQTIQIRPAGSSLRAPNQ